MEEIVGIQQISVKDKEVKDDWFLDFPSVFLDIKAVVHSSFMKSFQITLSDGFSVGNELIIKNGSSM